MNPNNFLCGLYLRQFGAHKSTQRGFSISFTGTLPTTWRREERLLLRYLHHCENHQGGERVFRALADPLFVQERAECAPPAAQHLGTWTAPPCPGKRDSRTESSSQSVTQHRPPRSSGREHGLAVYGCRVLLPSTILNFLHFTNVFRLIQKTLRVVRVDGAPCSGHQCTHCVVVRSGQPSSSLEVHRYV